MIGVLRRRRKDTQTQGEPCVKTEVETSDVFTNQEMPRIASNTRSQEKGMGQILP